MVIICQPSDTDRSVDDYNSLFWNFLRGLRIYDKQPWPENAPSKTDDNRWTFCFDGEPVFPIALTPAHEQRWSRHASTMVTAIQPKWVIDNLMSTPEKREAATSKVRGLLKKYDRIGVSPHLANYGAPGTSESQQLVLRDDYEKTGVLYSDMDA
jgi:FPC/CPF motif-containing protein YcgG